MTPFKKYLLLSLVFVAINAAVILVFFEPRYDNTDSPLYISAINFLSSGSGEFYPAIILKPFSLFLGVVLYPFFKPEISILVQNVIFYFLCSYLIFLIINKIYKNPKQAFLGVCLLSAAYPVMAYGLAILIDAGGWFFYLLGILFSLKFLEKQSIKNACLVGLISGLGMYFKEVSIIGVFFFTSIILIATGLTLKEKIKYIFFCGISFSALFLLKEIIIYCITSFNSLDWYFFAWKGIKITGKGFYYYTPLRITIEVFRAFIFGWVFFLIGFRKEMLEKNEQRAKILISFLIPAFSFLLWGWPHNRIMFAVLVPAVLLASYGILGRKENFIKETILLSLYVGINYFFLDFLLKYGIYFKNIF